ncbi:MAG: hypothetical protein ACRDT6_25775 [Micromonosporaceae bacterium]
MRLLSWLGRIGDGVDAVAVATRHTPSLVRRAGSLVRAAWAVPRYRYAGVGTGLVMLLLYLVSIGDVAAGTGRRGAGPVLSIAPGWAGRLTATRASWLFEPVAAVRPGSWLTVFVSPGNLLLGGVLAALVALHVSVTAYQVYAARQCRRTAFGRLLAVLPGFGVGIACCAPTLLLAMGTGFAATLIPVLLPVRGWLYPGAVLMLTGMLLWTARHPEGATTRRPEGATGPDLRTR